MHSSDILLDKKEEISIEKQEIEDYNKNVKVWEKFEKLEEIEKLDDEVLLFSKLGFNNPEMLPKPLCEFPPIIFLILDDLVGNIEYFKHGNCTISNIRIKH